MEERVAKKDKSFLQTLSAPGIILYYNFTSVACLLFLTLNYSLAVHRNFSLLSFGDEAEEDEEEIVVVSKVRIQGSPQDNLRGG